LIPNYFLDSGYRSKSTDECLIRLTSILMRDKKMMKLREVSLKMEASNFTKVTVQTVVKAPIEQVWSYWTEPQHITKWNQASEDWHAPRAENDLRTGGKFLTRMEAKDGSMGFDFYGVYDEVK